MPGIKVVVLGAHGVGKSSIVKHFAGNVQPQRRPGRKVYQMQYRLREGRSRPLEIMDSRPSFLGKLFKSDVHYLIKQGDAFIVVYALDDVRSYCNAMDTCLRVFKEKGSTDVPLVLVGNKFDLPCKVEAYRLKQLGDLPRLMISAKSGMFVHYAFDILLDIVKGVERKEEREKQAMARINSTWCYKRSQSIVQE